MSGTADYVPPASAEIAQAQVSVRGLRLLIAQRRLYSRAKFWLSLRWTGVMVIGIGAPALAFFVPDAAVWAGAVAGAWIFVGRTFLMKQQSSRTDRAAAVQEMFDMWIFGMPASVPRVNTPTLEEIRDLTGSDQDVQRTATKERLLDDGGWYPIDASRAALRTIAVCQRANASYADRLMRTTARAWGWTIGVWLVVLVVVSLVAELSLSTFIVGMALPLLPAFLDVVEYVSGIQRAAADRANLAQAIEDKISDDEVDSEDLIVWQNRLYELRRSSPEVPNLIYKLKRRKNEAAMHAAADELGSS
ncbi:S-4TM family putative pore-forming effector [Rhodococcus opacus]|uniref:S-4TM family putative pore-forming effector n=1 Tax=Rhodococcus opacus TaxID=37919 RepID=UPI002955020C|nr:S-4TM family putative pore-forming effector [Rhodococcus opacus]MDV7091013.1 S-4TM family putative pore-forming effector [Rhodococcus opacus]